MLASVSFTQDSQLILITSCLGKNLAWAELRLVLAKVLFNFDMELDLRSVEFERKLEHHTLWSRPKLWIKLTAVTE